ncbi:hypothetical protein SprV_0100410000 [Sparganum proliferum]
MSLRPHLPRPPPTLTINTDHTPEPPLPSSSVASTSAATAPAPTATSLNLNTPKNISLPATNTSDVDSVHTCPHCDRTFISHIGLPHVECMLMDTYRDERRIDVRTDGHLFNSRAMQTSTHHSTTTVHDLLFADDCTLSITTEEDMQLSIDLLSAVCAIFGLTISMDKTVIMRQPSPNTTYKVPSST